MNFKNIFYSSCFLGMGVTFQHAPTMISIRTASSTTAKVSLTLHRRLISSTSSATTASCTFALRVDLHEGRDDRTRASNPVPAREPCQIGSVLQVLLV